MLRTFYRTDQVKRTTHAGQGRKSNDELISDVLKWTPTHRQANP